MATPSSLRRSVAAASSPASAAASARASSPRLSPKRPTIAQRRNRPFERAVDEEAGADVGAEVEVRLQPRVLGDLAGEVMVEVADLHACLEQREERHPVHVERDVEHRAAIAALRAAGHLREQRDVALDAGDEGPGGAPSSRSCWSAQRPSASPLKT